MSQQKDTTAVAQQIASAEPNDKVLLTPAEARAVQDMAKLWLAFEATGKVVAFCYRVMRSGGLIIGAMIAAYFEFKTGGISAALKALFK